MLTSELGLTVAFDVPITYRGYSGANTVSNSGFETAGGGGADVFANWVEVDNGYATITQDGSVKHAGSYSCKFETTPGLFTGHVYIDISVTPDSSYYLSLYSIVGGDGVWESQGRYAVEDRSNSNWLLTTRGTGAFSANNWTLVTDIFSVPPTCTTIRLYLYQGTTAETSPAGVNFVYFDTISILRRDPLARAPAPEWGGSGRLGSYRHTSSVNVGFDNMQLTTAGTESYIGDWFESGLGRRVIVTAPSGMVWEGFVNEISANLGGSVLTLGPLVQVVNRGRIIYREMNWGTNPPVGGDTVRGEWVDIVESQSLYGVFEGMITGAEGTTDEMSQMINTITSGAAWPDVAQNINIGGGSEISITVSCLGYGHLLDKYYYTEVSTADMIDVTTKIAKILDRDPNRIFSSYNMVLSENTTQTSEYENSDRTSMAILKEIAAMGDDEYNRYVFGVFENRLFSYWNATVLDPKYFWSMRTGRVELANTAPVEPYEVRPGEWVHITDLMASKPSFGINAKTDPRFMFLESVTYAAPYTLSMTGGRANTFRQRLDRLGVGGI